MTDGGFQIFYSYKPTIQGHDLNVIADALFGRSDQNIIRCDGVCMFNEVLLSAAGAGMDTGIVVHIGANATTVIPIFKSDLLSDCMQSTTVGEYHDHI